MKFHPFNHPRFLLVAGLAAALSGAAAAPAAAQLSADAQKIVAKVEQENPDIEPVCSNVAELKAAVTKATTELAEAKELTEDPHKAGEEAGKYLYGHCPPAN